MALLSNLEYLINESYFKWLTNKALIVLIVNLL